MIVTLGLLSPNDEKILNNAIKYLIDEHKKISDEWINQTKSTLNLKKKTLRYLNDNPEAEELLFNYISFLELETLNIRKELLSEFQIRTRVKTSNSIWQKKETYLSNSHQGNIPINKCFNDLLGTRIILDDFRHQDIQNLLSKLQTYSENLKCIDSSKNGYYGTHIYFHLNNFTFPWELRVWKKSDEKSNIESHKIYKQDYTGWEREI